MSLVGRYYDPTTGQFLTVDPDVAETGQPYAYTGDDPVNGTDPLGLCSTSDGTFLVSGACRWTSRSWVSQTENTLQGQKGGGFSITNGLKALADYGAGIGNAAVSTVTLGHVHVAPPYCGFGWASDVGMGYGFVALTLLSGGSGGAAEVSDGAATIEEIEAEGQTSSLAGRVNELQEALDPFAQTRRTSVILSTQEGTDILASGGRDLSTAQQALASEGDILARLPGAHAEVTALDAASKAGLTPAEMAVSRGICPPCQAAIEASGGTINPDELGATWP